MWSQSAMKVLEKFPVSDWKDEDGEDWWWSEFLNCHLKEEYDEMFVKESKPEDFIDLVLKDLKGGMKVKDLLVKYLR